MVGARKPAIAPALRRRLLELAAEADEIHYDRCIETGTDLPAVLLGERIRLAIAGAAGEDDIDE